MQNEDPTLTSEQLEARDAEAYRWLVADARGRLIVRAIRRWSGADETGVLGQPAEMGEAIGRRLIGNLLKAQIVKHDATGWLQLESEHLQEMRLIGLLEARREEQFEVAAGKTP